MLRITREHHKEYNRVPILPLTNPKFYNPRRKFIGLTVVSETGKVIAEDTMTAAEFVADSVTYWDKEQNKTDWVDTWPVEFTFNGTKIWP